MAYGGALEKLAEKLTSEAAKFVVMIGLIMVSVWFVWGKMEGKETQLREVMERNNYEHREEIRDLRIKTEQCQAFQREVLQAVVEQNTQAANENSRHMRRLLRVHGINPDE